MRKIFTLIALLLLTQHFVTAQTVTSTTVNFRELAAYEAAHPELFKPCPTCPRKEADGGWEDYATPNLPLPPGANVKMAAPIPTPTNNPTPMVPSRAPVQNWLGHTDPGNVIPPDTYGAVGLTQVMTATNDFVRVHAKTGGAVLSSVSISTFTARGSTCDPQVFFDPSTQRWIFCAIECTSNGNRVILMTSNTSDAMGTWRKIEFVPVSGDGSVLLDHPYLGYDDTKIVIGGRKFPGGFSGPMLFLFVKADMLSGAPIVAGSNFQTIEGNTSQGDCPRPVTVYFPPFSNSGNPTPGTVYILQSWNNSSLRLTTVTGNIPTCTWNTGSAVFPTAPDSWTSGGQGNDIKQQPPETRLIAGNDARISSAIMMNGKIWAVHHIAFPAGATGAAVTHVDAQYWQLDGAAATLGTVMQRGRTGAVAGQFRWFASIAVNKIEDVIVGYSISDATTMWPSAGYSTRQAGTPANTLDDPRVYHAGEARYWKDFGSGRTRWGDYSQSHLDPSDNSLWTIEQYASTPAGAIPPDNNSRYGVWWAQVPSSSALPTPIIAPAGATIISESCAPANGAIDPGETVTVSFCLQNTGSGPTVNAVGTLLPTGGVVSPSAPQNYGVIVNGGPPVCRNFTFTNSSTTCGSTITASIQVTDGATTLGTVTYTFTLGTTVVVSTQNFDAVTVPNLPAGWVATNAVGAAPLWVTSNSGTPAPASFSAPNVAFVNDPSTTSDKRLDMPSFVPAYGASLSFRHNYSLETNWDGGVVEISINGGAFQDIIAAGGSFVTGGYTNTLNSSANPIGGRQAWSGSSGGSYLLTTINLPTASAGLPTVIRFRMGSDGSVAGVGWRVDDVVVSQPSCCGLPCTLTCPANMTVPSASGCGANVSFSATASGLCGPITYNPASGSFFPVGTTTVNVTTASGASCSFTVTVTDATPPTIVCPAPITVNNTPNLCGANVTYPYPTVGDNCALPGGTAVTLNQSTNTTLITPIQIGCQYGATGFTAENSWWRAYNLAPLNLPAGISVKSVRFGIEKITGGPVPITARIYRQTAGTFPAGSRVLIASQTQTFPVQTGTFQTITFSSPAAASPTDVLVVELYCPDQFAAGRGFFIGSNAAPETGPSYISAAACGIVTPTDLADIGFPDDNIHLAINGEYYITPPTLVQTAGIASGGFFPVGVTTNTFRATDAAGNQSFCSFTVTVVDAQPPTVVCPANQVRNTDPGQCYATFTPPQPTITDNCPGITKVTWVMTGATTGASPLTGINYVPSTQFGLTGTTGVGVTTITYTVTDASGNTSTCQFNVTVNDASIPVIGTQPATKFFCVGTNGVFSVIATAGTGNPLTYQWQEWNGSAWVNITGATAASYTIPNVSFADNTRSFRVILTGRCSVVTSQFATLYVNPLPTVNIVTSIPPSLLPGQTLNLTTVVSPAGGTYQWFKNGVAMSNTGSSLTGLTVDDIGTYHVTYTDPNGCVKTSADVVVSGLPSDNLFVYPIPNNGQFTVRFFNADNENATIRVFDSKGAMVYEKAQLTGTAYTALDVDLGPTISSGVYVVVANNSAGKKIGAKRIVVRRKP
jgi:hypothetical protein